MKICLEELIEIGSGEGQWLVLLLRFHAALVQIAPNESLVTVEVHQIEDLLLGGCKDIQCTAGQLLFAEITRLGVNVDRITAAVGQMLAKDLTCHRHTLRLRVHASVSLTGGPEVDVLRGELLLEELSKGLYASGILQHELKGCAPAAGTDILWRRRRLHAGIKGCGDHHAGRRRWRR